MRIKGIVICMNINKPNVAETIAKLTLPERAVFAALVESSEANDHRFGCVEDARGAVPKRSVVQIVASLAEKKLLVVHETTMGEAGPFTEINLSAEVTGWAVEWVLCGGE